MYGWRLTDDEVRVAKKSAAPLAAKTPTVFSLVEALVPSWLAREQIGDAQEVLDRMKSEAAPRWLVYAKIVSTVAWVLVNALRELAAAIRGKALHRK